MKRRLLALLCALGLTISMVSATEAGDTPAPTETAGPVESVEPSTAPSPEETVPSETVTPEETAPAETPAPIVYTDVPETEWYAEEVMAVTKRGIMTGVDDGLFAPLDPVTRAMVITVLWRLSDCPEVESQDLFPDVTADDPATAWYLPQAAWAKEVGIASGYEDGTFRGDDPVSREELAAFFFRYASYTGQPIGKGILALFGDAADVSDWAQEAMCHAVGVGLYRGDDLGNLNPQSTATRAELAAILQRMLSPAVG